MKVGNETYRLKMGVALGGSGAGDVRINAHGGTNRLMLSGGTGDDLTIQDGYVGIGTISPTSKLQVNGGNIQVTNGSFIDDCT